MSDHQRSRAELIEEMESLRDRITQLESGDTERRRVEAELRASEARLRTAVENMPFDFFMLDEDGHYVTLNSTAKARGGDVTGKRPADVDVDEETLALWESNNRRAFAGEVVKGEVRLSVGGHEGVYYNVVAPIVDDGRIRGILGVNVDITERKLAEDALRQSEQKYRTLFETMTQGVVYQDAEGQITAANEAACEILGLTLDQMQGRTSYDPRWKAIHLDGSDFPGESHPSMVALATGEQVHDVLMGVFHPGREAYRWINVNAIPQFRSGENKPYQVYIVFSDVTERVLAEQKLRASEERFRLAFDHASVGRVMAVPDGRFVRVNRSFCAISGYTEEEVLARRWQDMVHPDFMAANLEAARRLLKGEVPSFQLEIRVNHKQGKLLWVNLNVVLIKDDDGHPLFMLGDIEDITERKCAEQALLESEQKFRSLADKSPNMIFINKGGRVVYANDRCVELMGYHKEEFYADDFDFMQLVASESVDTVQAALRAHRCGEEVLPYEYALITKDGSVLHAILTSKLIQYGGESAILGIVTDITARRRAEKALRQSEERYRSVFENAPIGLGIADSKGNLRSYNEAMLLPGGYTPDDIARIGNVAALYYDPTERQRVLAKARKYGSLHGQEVTFKRKDGTPYYARLSLVPIDIDGEMGWQALVEDITESKRAREALERLEREKRLILDSSSELISYQDLDYRLVWVNQACGRSVGMKAEELIGRHCYEIWPQGAEPCERCPVTRVLETGRPQEGEMSTEDGRSWLIHGSPVYDENGQLTGAVEVTVDITERKRMENELSHARRLEAAGQLAGQIAHDFNNLLGPLVAYPDLIRSKIGTQGRVEEMLADMEEAARQIADINQQLLTLGRRGHYKTERIDLNDLADRTLRGLQLSEGIAVKMNRADDLLPIRGGPAQLARILANVIANAAEAMVGQGTLTLTTENVYLDRPLRRYASIEIGEYVRLDVTDTGQGISPNVIDHIFDPFFTTKKADRRRGSGLGLTVARSVLEDHKGYLDVQTEPGHGSTFSLFFPVDRQDDALDDASSSLSQGQGERVLVVDDDPLQLRIAQRALTQLGYHVQTAKSGEDAIAIVENDPQDVMLVDMVMDGIDGVETLRRIRVINPDQRAIVFSGFAPDSKVEAARALGAGEFLSKPVQLTALAEAIHRTLNDRVSSAPPTA